MRYSVLTLSAALLLGSVSFASAQSLRDDLDRMTGEAPASGLPSVAPNYMGNDYNAAPRSQADINVPQLAQVNQPAPDFNLVLGNLHQPGVAVTMQNVIQQGPAVILFTPGTIAYTQPLLDLLQKNIANFQQVGIQPVAVSTDPVTVLSKTNYNYMVLSDPSGLAMRHYGAIKQANYVVPVLVSINAQGVIVDMQETLNPDLNRAVRALRTTEAVTAVETKTVATTAVAQPNHMTQIQQVTKVDEMVVNQQGKVVGAQETVRREIASISDKNIPQFPPVEQQVPQLPPAVNAAPSAGTMAPAMPPAVNNATTPSVPPAYMETQIQSY